MTFRLCARLSAAAFALTLAAAAGADEPARLPVDMPAAAAAAVRAEMLAKLNALHRVHTALAAGQPAEAAEFAERHLGMAAMGQHATLPPEARPGRYLPEAMMAIGRQSHRHGSELAAALKTGDRPRIDAALRDVTATCVACHSAYRLQ
jgi:hypothetical protein